jgi:hypothetical protein
MGPSFRWDDTECVENTVGTTRFGRLQPTQQCPDEQTTRSERVTPIGSPVTVGPEATRRSVPSQSAHIEAAKARCLMLKLG